MAHHLTTKPDSRRPIQLELPVTVAAYDAQDLKNHQGLIDYRTWTWSSGVK